MPLTPSERVAKGAEMLAAEKAIDQEVYFPQHYFFLWNGEYQLPYLADEEATARQDAVSMVKEGWPIIELWRCDGGDKNTLLGTWRMTWT